MSGVLSAACQFCHISLALSLHLCFHHSTTLLASDLLAAVYPWLFSHQSFGGERDYVSFSLQEEWSYTLCHKASPSPQKGKGSFCFGIHHTLTYITNNICRQDGKISSLWDEQGNFLCTSVFTYSNT